MNTKAPYMKPYKYQTDYLQALPKSIIMSADVGTGKTAMALWHYQSFGVERPLLILAPAAKVNSGDWERELDRVFGSEKPSYKVLSYDKFARNPGLHLEYDMAVIADECHRVAESQTKRGKAFAMMSKLSDQVILLSATPLPNGWRSAANYGIVFGFVKNKTEFWRRFVREDRSRGFPIILGYNYEDKLKQWWSKVAKPLARDQAIDLPEAINVPVSIELSKAKFKEYITIKAKRVLNDEILDSAPLLYARMRQWLAPHRIEALEEILEGTDEHVVIFYNYNAEREEILKLLSSKFKKRQIYEQSGQASTLPKHEDWAKLPRSTVTLAQYQSASEAVEMTYASVTVYYSPTYSYKDYYQSRGRTHRNGQSKKTVFYHFRVNGTLDQQVWTALKNKQDFQFALWEADN